MSGNCNMINVRDFGAVGDGTTDDTTALNDAADQARLLGAGLLLPPTADAYLVSDTIDFSGIRYILGVAAQIKGNLGAKPMVLIGNATGVMVESSIWIEVYNTPNSSVTDGNIGIKVLGLRSSKVTYFARGFDTGLYFDGAGGVARNWLDNVFYPLRSYNNGTHVHFDLADSNYAISNEFTGGSYYLGSNAKKSA